MESRTSTTPKYIAFLTIFLLKLLDIRYAADTNRYTGNMYSAKPITPKKKPDTVSPTIPHILKLARRRNTENAKSTIKAISLCICFCLASSSSLAFLSMAALDLAFFPEDVFEAVCFFLFVPADFETVFFEAVFAVLFAPLFLSTFFDDVLFTDFLFVEAIFYL